ncbi:MAG: tetratricopeptide repeat protein [Bacteroidaceae bacterium]|nr:tetratricopeptide repeat protein [Bacteroidaceae bacterium]
MANKNVIVEEAAQEQSFLVKNWKKVAIGCGAIAVVALGCVGYTKLVSEPKELAAAEAIAASENYIKQGDFEKALAGDGQNIGLQAELDQYGSTKSGNLAQLYAGVAYYNEGKYDEAIKALESFDDCGDNMVSPAAIAALGNCYACKGDNQKGAELLVKAAAKADNASLSPVFYIQAGELYELALNNKEKALECYNKVKDSYKAAYQVQSGEIDKYIERASVK